MVVEHQQLNPIRNQIQSITTYARSKVFDRVIEQAGLLYVETWMFNFPLLEEVVYHPFQIQVINQGRPLDTEELCTFARKLTMVLDFAHSTDWAAPEYSRYADSPDFCQLIHDLVEGQLIVPKRFILRNMRIKLVKNEGIETGI